jgi:hypothetical protein
MCCYRLAFSLVIVFLLSPIATYTQTSLVQPSTSLSNTGDWQFPSARRYREISIYSGQTFGNPQIMSGLGGQHLFLARARLTGRLITTPHLYISGNADVRPLALYSRDIEHGREYTYGEAGPWACNLLRAAKCAGGRISMPMAASSPSLTTLRCQIRSV